MGGLTVRYKLGIASVCIAALLAVIPVYAHHPFSAEYDANKPVNMMGTVTKVDWENPHAHIYMDVKGTAGETEHWTVELANPKKLQNLGWKKDMVKMGEQITVEGWQARDGSNRANANMVTLAGGKKMAAGSSNSERKKEKPTDN
jgi:Family of unknown function (DUF6152)